MEDWRLFQQNPDPHPDWRILRSNSLLENWPVFLTGILTGSIADADGRAGAEISDARGSIRSEAIYWIVQLLQPILTPISIKHTNTHTIHPPFRLGRPQSFPHSALHHFASMHQVYYDQWLTHSVPSIDLHSFIHNLCKCITTILPVRRYSSAILSHKTPLRE